MSAMSSILPISKFLCLVTVVRLDLSPIDLASLPSSLLGGITKWVSVDMGPSMLAPWGTKVGALAKPKSVTNYLDLSNIDDGVSSPFDVETLSPVIDAADSAWRSDIAVGTLLDARDLQNVWYQVSR
jgi:hypothetical protein